MTIINGLIFSQPISVIFTIKNKYLNLSSELKKFLSVSFYPISSYYYYLNKKYDLAINELNLFFKNYESILSSNPKINILATYEQQLNLFRLYFSKNDFINAKQIASKLILNVFKDKIIIIIITNFEERESWVHYILNSILRRYIYDLKHKKELIKLIFCIYTHDIDHNIFYFIKTLNNLYQKKTNNSLEKMIITTLKKDRNIPNILVYIFLLELNLYVYTNSLNQHENYKNITNKYLKKMINDFNKDYIIKLI